MLTILVATSDQELFDEEKNTFIAPPTIALTLEHSLVSLSKWESKHEKHFIGNDSLTPEENHSYIELMTLNEIPPDILLRLSAKNIEEIQAYINAKMTATWFNEADTPKRSREVITSELIYYWMVSLNIPFECQEWHLNRLLTLIRVCNVKNAPPKKMSKTEAARRQRSLNAERQARLKTRG